MRNLTNSMVAHVWAQRNTTYGENGSGSYSFNGPELISYNTTIGWHFGKFVLLSDDNMSPTTGKQLSLAARAVTCDVIYVDGIFSWGARRNYRGAAPKGTEIKKALLTKIHGLAESYAKRRTESTKAHDLHRVGDAIKDLQTVCEHFGLKFPKGYEAPETALGVSAAAVERARKAAKRAAAKAKRDAEKAKEARRAHFERWLAGEVEALPYQYETTCPAQLTVRGDTVYTTGRAEAPLEHVKKAFALYDRVMKADPPETGPRWTRNGERARLGFFDLETIDRDGNVKVGCHVIHAKELQRFRGLWNV